MAGRLGGEGAVSDGVSPAELAPVSVRLLEVVADDLVELALILGRGAQPLRKADVQLGPPGLGDELVGGIANEQVREAIALLAGEQALGRAHELAPLELGEGRVDVHAALVSQQRRDHAAVESAALDRRRLDHPARPARQPVDSRGQEGLDAGRRRPGRIVGAHRDQVLEEQRVALGGSQQLVPAQTGAAAPREPAQEPRRVGVRQRPQAQRRAPAERGLPSRPALEQIVAGQADDPDRRRRHVCSQVLDQVEQRRLGPLDVVECDHERAHPGERFEQPAHGPLHVLRRRRRARAPDRARHHVGHARRLPVARHERLERRHAAQVVDDLLERPVGDALAVGQAAPDDDAGAGLDVGDELLDEPRLADPGRPEHGRDDAAVGGDAAVVAAAQARELAAAADHPAGRRHPQRLAAWHEALGEPGAHAPGLPAQLEIAVAAQAHRPGDEPASLGTEQHGAGGRRRLQP